MPFVPVPKDLTKVETKVALNLTKRQLICFSLAAAVGVPTYLLTHTAIGNDVAVILMIGLMMPFFFFAMFERDGQPAEKLLRNYVRARLWPGVRPYKTQNLYKYLQEEGPTIAETNKATGPAGTKASAIFAFLEVIFLLEPFGIPFLSAYFQLKHLFFLY